MAGMISTGQGYGSKALSGFIRESAQQAQIDLANKQKAAAEDAQAQQMAVQGGVVGYMSAPTIAEWMAPETSLESGAGQSAMQGIAGTTAAPAGTVAGQTSGAVIGSVPEAAGESLLLDAGGGVAEGAGSMLAAPVSETAAGSVAAEAGTALASEAAAGAAGAEIGGEAGMALGPMGIIAGAGLGYLLSKLF